MTVFWVLSLVHSIHNDNDRGCSKYNDYSCKNTIESDNVRPSDNRSIELATLVISVTFVMMFARCYVHSTTSTTNRGALAAATSWRCSSNAAGADNNTLRDVSRRAKKKRKFQPIIGRLSTRHSRRWRCSSALQSSWSSFHDSRVVFILYMGWYRIRAGGCPADYFTYMDRY